MKVKPLRQQLIELKEEVTNILSFEVLEDVEDEILTDLYELINNILLEKIESKYYTMEDVADARILEFSIMLGSSKNEKVKKLVKKLKKGILW